MILNNLQNNNHNLPNQYLYHNPEYGDGKVSNGFGTYSYHLAQICIIKINREFVGSL